MKIFVAEKASIEPKYPLSLRRQGKLMLNSLVKGIQEAGHEPLIPTTDSLLKGIEKEAPKSDAGLVIAPDRDLNRYTSLLSEETTNLGPSKEFIEKTVDKKLTLQLLEEKVPVPEIGPSKGKRVVKPRKGCGAEGVKIIGEEKPVPNPYFATEYVSGEHASVVLVEGKAVSLSSQFIELKKGGKISYRGNKVPLNHLLKEEAFKAAEKTVKELGGGKGIIGIDFVLSKKKPFLIEINPRPTVSIVPLEKVLKPNIFKILADKRFKNISLNEIELKINGEASINC